MQRFALALVLLVFSLGTARGADAPAPRDGTSRQLAEFDRIVSRYKVVYADSQRLIQSGPRVFVSTSAAKVPDEREKLKLTQELLRRDKETLANMTSLSAAVGSTKPSTSTVDSAACAKDFSYERMMSSYGTSWTVDEVPTAENLESAVLLRELCVGAASRAQDLCASTSKIFDLPPRTKVSQKPDHSDMFTYRDVCRRTSVNVQLIMALAQGPVQGRARCESVAADAFAPGKAHQACGILNLDSDTPQAAAAKIKPFLRDASPPMDKVAGDLAIILGRPAPGYCESRKKEGFGINAEICAGSAAYRKARQGGGAAACGSSPMCKAFMGGGPAVCEPYARAAMNLFCRRNIPAAQMKQEGKDAGVAKLSKERGAQFAKIKADEEEVHRHETYLQQLETESNASSQQVAFAKALSSRHKELRDLLDQAYAVINGAEPKSHPGIAERREMIPDLQDDLVTLEGQINDLTHSRPRARKKGAPAKSKE